MNEIGELEKILDLALSNNHSGIPLSKRPYQLELAFEAISSLDDEHMIINMPTGTGKTLIVNLISLAWKNQYPNSKILYIVPTRLLLNQHKEFVKWCADGLNAFTLTERNSNHHQKVSARTRRADVIISTPLLFYNRLKTIPLEVIESIDLIVVDEFDDFLVFEYGADTDSDGAYFSEDFNPIVEFFKNARFLMISATSPLHETTESIFAKAFVKLVNARFNPALLSSDSPDIIEFLPKAKIILTPVVDEDVMALNSGINTAIRSIKDYIVNSLSYVPDFDHLLKRAAALPKINEDILKALNGIKANIYKKNFLFEDLFKNIEYKEELKSFLNWSWVETQQGVPRYEETVFVLDDLRKDKDEYHPELRGKFSALLSIIERHSGEKCVVFLRFTRLSDLICKELKKPGINSLQIDGRLSTEQLEMRMTEFKKGPVNILLLIRDSGGRGLDLPQANYAIFYSPKVKEDSVWQELSRIRSNVSKAKLTYFLYYTQTDEAEKMQELREQMEASNRLYEFITISELADRQFDES